MCIGLSPVIRVALQRENRAWYNLRVAPKYLWLLKDHIEKGSIQQLATHELEEMTQLAEIAFTLRMEKLLAECDSTLAGKIDKTINKEALLHRIEPFGLKKSLAACQ